MDKEIDDIVGTSTILDGDLNKVAISLLHPQDYISQPCAITEGRIAVWYDEQRDRYHQVGTSLTGHSLFIVCLYHLSLFIAHSCFLLIYLLSFFPF